MIWPQAAVSFLVWIGYGAWMRGRSERLRARLMGSSRGFRVFLGSAGLILSAFALLGGLAGISALGGVQEGGLLLWAWLAVTLLGLGFVHLQVLGAAAMITIVQERETHNDRPPSESREETA